MNELIKSYGLLEKKGEPVVSSRKVAEIFSKDHDKVLRDIKNLDCSSKFSTANFGDSNYKVRGKSYQEVIMTKDGFAFLVMGFTGKKAAMFKENYIEAFNEMKDFIQSLNSAKLEHPAFTQAIMDAHAEPKHYHFSAKADMINRIVLGIPAKKYRELNGIEKGKSIRPYLSTNQIKAIEYLQRIDIGMILAIPEYDERKHKLTELHQLNIKRIGETA